VQESTFIRLCYVDDHVGLAMLRGLLEAEGIDFYVHNDSYGSMVVGPHIGLYNERSVMVAREDYPRAKELHEDFLMSMRDDEAEEKPARSFGDWLRMIAEFFLFGWFIPGRRSGRGSGRDSGEE